MQRVETDQDVVEAMRQALEAWIRSRGREPTPRAVSAALLLAPWPDPDWVRIVRERLLPSAER